MNHKDSLYVMTTLMFVFVFLAACGTLQGTPTPVPPTATSTQILPTTTPTPTPTPTPIPGGIVTGRVYLMDRDESFRTTVKLTRHEGFEEVESIATDENGYYSFLVEDPDTYVIQVSVMDLLDTCDNLRTESGGWMGVQIYDSSGVADVLATSPPISITIVDEIKLDCELYCD